MIEVSLKENKNLYYFILNLWWIFWHVLFLCMLPPKVVSDTGCSLSSIQGKDKSQSETGMGGTFLSPPTQNKREELQDKTAKVTVQNREHGSQCYFSYYSVNYLYHFIACSIWSAQDLHPLPHGYGCILTWERVRVSIESAVTHWLKRFTQIKQLYCFPTA